MTQSMEGLLPRLEQLGKVAKQHKSLQFDNLLHHLNLALLHKAFNHLNRRAAKGVDNLGWFEYQENSADSLGSLYQRIQSGRYKCPVHLSNQAVTFNFKAIFLKMALSQCINSICEHKNNV